MFQALLGVSCQVFADEMLLHLYSANVCIAFIANTYVAVIEIASLLQISQLVSSSRN